MRELYLKVMVLFPTLLVQEKHFRPWQIRVSEPGQLSEASEVSEAGEVSLRAKEERSII